MLNKLLFTKIKNSIPLIVLMKEKLLTFTKVKVAEKIKFKKTENQNSMQ